MRLRYVFGGYKVRIKKHSIVFPWGSLFTNPQPLIMTFRFSASIENFAKRVRVKHGIYEWNFKSSLFDPTAFIGLYHEGDYVRLIIHRGPKLAFWCGGDILRLQKKPFWQWVLRRIKVDHVCENEVEQKALKKMGIIARIHPILFFDDYAKFPLSFKPSTKPHVWLTCHPGREREYGVELVKELASKVSDVTFHIFGIEHPRPDTPTSNWSNAGSNIIYHGQVPSEKMDEMIKDYHCGLRINDFDGCPHAVTKGVLLGQWSISKIPYPHVDTYKTKKDLIKLLKKLKHKKKPNLEGHKYWLEVVSNFPWS